MTSPDWVLTALQLDNARHNKQITEALQIYTAIIDPEYGWQKHPTVNRWRPNKEALLVYGMIMYAIWRKKLHDGLRGGKLDHKSGEKIFELLNKITTKIQYPEWPEEVYASHRACLLAKDYDYYSQFGWKEKPTPPVNGKWPYVWVV